MQNSPAWGTPYYVTVTGATVITSANAQIIGILFQSTGTANLQIWAGTTATATSAGVPLSGVIRAYPTAADATVNKAVYFPFPAYASGGITINMGASADPRLTLFWNPTGGA